MTRLEAREIAVRYIADKQREIGCDLILLDEHTMERDFGWVFFYDSKQHVDTGDFRFGLVGNAPIVVARADGQLHETGTAFPVEHYLKDFEKF